MHFYGATIMAGPGDYRIYYACNVGSKVHEHVTITPLRIRRKFTVVAIRIVPGYAV